MHMCSIIDRCACMAASVFQRGVADGRQPMINLTERLQFMVLCVSVIDADKVCAP